jgi:hypothetical protein
MKQNLRKLQKVVAPLNPFSASPICARRSPTHERDPIPYKSNHTSFDVHALNASTFEYFVPLSPLPLPSHPYMLHG